MINGLTPRLENFLLNISRIQSRASEAQQQVSSGLRLRSAVDDPGSVDRLLRADSGLAAAEQTQKNMTVVKAEVEVGSNAVQAAIKLMDEALTLGSQASSGAFGTDKRTILAEQLAGLQARMVNTSAIIFNGRYVFSGDLDGTPSYALNLTNPNGVDRLATPTSTLRIANSDGTHIAVGRTAQELFDRRDSIGSFAPENVFAALQNLRVAVESGADATVASALDQVRTAQNYLNTQGAGYGSTLTRLTAAQGEAASAQAQWKITLSEIRDADIASSILEMQQLHTQLTASMSAQAQYPRTSLFDYLK